MVDVNITKNNPIIFSLSLDGTFVKDAEYYNKLKKFLISEIGVISYINPAEYEDGNDFAFKYRSVKYNFEE